MRRGGSSERCSAGFGRCRSQRADAQRVKRSRWAEKGSSMERCPRNALEREFQSVVYRHESASRAAELEGEPTKNNLFHLEEPRVYKARYPGGQNENPGWHLTPCTMAAFRRHLCAYGGPTYCAHNLAGTLQIDRGRGTLPVGREGRRKSRSISHRRREPSHLFLF
jgi:hypothetical protein